MVVVLESSNQMAHEPRADMAHKPPMADEPSWLTSCPRLTSHPWLISKNSTCLPHFSGSSNLNLGGKAQKRAGLASI